MRISLGDTFDLTTHTYSGFESPVDITTDSPHAALFLLLLRLGAIT